MKRAAKSFSVGDIVWCSPYSSGEACDAGAHTLEDCPEKQALIGKRAIINHVHHEGLGVNLTPVTDKEIPMRLICCTWPTCALELLEEDSTIGDVWETI